MFKLPDGIPALRSSAQEWADYAEYKAIKKGGISLMQLIKFPMMVGDEVDISGIEDETDRFINKADEIAQEIYRRQFYTKSRYPFQLIQNDYALQYLRSNDHFDVVYRFLLFSTRLRMTKDNIQNSFDGTKLFEILSAEVALSFFGEHAVAEVFGTSKSSVGGFRSKLSVIAKRMGEGGLVREHPGYRPQDDNLDVIVWKGFSDKRASQMIGFGQCKTGTSWHDKLSELNTESFCKKWFTHLPILTPVRMFFCAQYFPNDIWDARAYDAGLVFDRFRIMDYLPNRLDNDLVTQLNEWCSGAESLY